MALKQYTIESMSYLTTGMLDCGEEDASVEAAMCKVCNALRMMQKGIDTFILYQAFDVSPQIESRPGYLDMEQQGDNNLID